MKSLFKISCLFLLYFAGSMAQTSSEITSADLKKHLYYLASDEMKGRLSGSKEIFEAAKYLSNEYKSYGLKPLLGDSYFQEFSFIQDIKLSGNNSVTISFDTPNNGDNLNRAPLVLKLKEDFITAPFSGTGKASANLIFAGYGIDAPKLNYSDYKGIDVKGKIVLVLRGTPENENPHSEFDKYASLRNKAAVAMDKGALAIIFVNGYIPKDDEDKLLNFKYDRVQGMKTFPVIQIKRSFADELFKFIGKDFAAYQLTMKDSSSHHSFNFENVNVSLTSGVEEVNATCRNVGAILEGNDPLLKNEYVVIGAHYDHLGMGIEGSLYKGTEEQVHNGADDNASGTSGVLELAQKFASEKGKNKRSLIFINFSGEELGLLGSAYFVNNSPVAIEKIDAMLNLDMVGRLGAEKQLTIYGTGTSSKWKEILNNKNSYGFKLAFVDEGYGPSDQTSFYAKKIPVLFYFTGVHTDYHRPTDDANLINYDGEESITKFVYETTSDIASLDKKPDYIDIPRKESSGGWKVYVGTIPDYSTTGEGFRLQGVSPGSPADKGGLKGGDIMIRFGSRKINNIYDYVYALQDHVPGDEVEVVIKRNNEQLSFKVVLGAK